MSSSFTDKKAGEILHAFLPEATLSACTPCTGGLINSTWFLETDRGTLVLQKVNRTVFARPDEVMENIVAVTSHLAEKGEPTLHFFPLASAKSARPEEPRTKSSRPADGSCYLYTDRDGSVYRLSRRLPGKPPAGGVTPSVFRRAGQAFGSFQKALADFDASRLHETIPDFHNTPRRLDALADAVEKDPLHRLAGCEREVDFILSHRAFASIFTDALASGELPLRVVHNDTKINNLILAPDADTVIDLDTVMPGTLLYDFGDGVRSGAATRPEGSEDYKNTTIDPALYRAFLEGFLAADRETLTPFEIRHFPHSVALIALELGCRFLTDHLLGDVYFRISRPGENLVRARGQLALCADVLSRLDAFTALTPKGSSLS